MSLVRGGQHVKSSRWQVPRLTQAGKTSCVWKMNLEGGRSGSGEVAEAGSGGSGRGGSGGVAEAGPHRKQLSKAAF